MYIFIQDVSMSVGTAYPGFAGLRFIGSVRKEMDAIPFGVAIFFCPPSTLLKKVCNIYQWLG